MPFEQQLIFSDPVGAGFEYAYIGIARTVSRCLWRKTLNSQHGATAAAGKAALRLNGGGEKDDRSPENAGGALFGLTPEEQSHEILSLVLNELDDDKAEDVVTIDLAGKSDIADCMVVASGRSQRHVGAMADKIVRRLKDAGFGRACIEGAPACDWVLIDARDVIVHIFRPEVRNFYNLERIWSAAAQATPAITDA